MLQIRIDQQFAQIGLNIQKSFLGLRTTQPQIELDIKKPELKIHSPRPKVYIDQRQCFADMDRRAPDAFGEYNVQFARREAFEAIGEIAAEGDILAQIENGATIEDIAGRAMDRDIDYNVTAIPKQPPKIEADVRPVEIELIRGRVDLQLQRGRVENLFEWGKVNVYIEQKNYLNISWEEMVNVKG
ncbi:MAG: hypothetical protein GX333_01860 [Syntrophomonadaceae bacterium]|nr:hypothetical protein [Syntrophomonadaceae bacterium]